MSRRPAIAALLLAVACNQGFDHESSQQAIVNGAPSFGDDAIVALLSDGVQYCSGTLVIYYSGLSDVNRV